MADELALVLNQQLAVRLNTPQFTELMQKISAYEVQSANVRVTNDAEYQMATDSLVAVADVGKALENLRKEIVAYPNTFAATVNATFKTLKDRCQKARERLEYHAVVYKNKKDAEFAKQQAELAAAQQAQIGGEVMDLDGEEAQGMSQAPPHPPLQSVKATNGAGSVSYRKGPAKIEILNPAKLIRAALDSRNKIPTAVISIDAAELRKAVESGIFKPKQWEKYGVKVTEQQQMVVRT